MIPFTRYPVSSYTSPHQPGLCFNPTSAPAPPVEEMWKLLVDITQTLYAYQMRPHDISISSYVPPTAVDGPATIKSELDALKSSVQRILGDTSPFVGAFGFLTTEGVEARIRVLDQFLDACKKGRVHLAIPDMPADSDVCFDTIQTSLEWTNTLLNTNTENRVTKTTEVSQRSVTEVTAITLESFSSSRGSALSTRVKTSMRIQRGTPRFHELLEYLGPYYADYLIKKSLDRESLFTSSRLELFVEVHSLPTFNPLRPVIQDALTQSYTQVV